MAGRDEKTREQDGARRVWRSVPTQGGAFLVAALLISALLHIVSGVKLTNERPVTRTTQLPKDAIKVRVVQVPPKKKQPEEKKTDDPDKLPKILETPQEKTERPDAASYAGNVDHKTEKETRLSEKIPRDKAKDPGQKGTPDARPGVPDQPKTAEQKPQPEQPKPPQKPERKTETAQPSPQDPKAPTIKSKTGSLAVESFDRKPRNQYEALLPTGVQDLPGQLNAGYQDFVDEKIEEGDRIDINTTEYRFIGYFTNMRKAIELVWNYPIEASRRGMQGEVGLEFAIAKDGKTSKIRVIKSSGYEILDRAIVDAIKLASPFAPLPDGFGKERILVTGSFRYILSSYGSH